MREGWFVIRGQQRGLRTIEEQMKGLEQALPMASGKTVLDIGAAEGLISREFARAGAKVTAVEVIEAHCEVAREVCAGLDVTVVNGHLAEIAAGDELAAGWQHDIVLALGVVHKLRDPGVGLRFSARAAREVMLLRMRRNQPHGVLRSKHDGVTGVHVAKCMADEGFRLEQTVPGPRDEIVQFWRRNRLG